MVKRWQLILGLGVLIGAGRTYRTLDRDHRQPHTKLFHPRL
jgi:hypothetical protein